MRSSVDMKAGERRNGWKMYALYATTKYQWQTWEPTEKCLPNYFGYSFNRQGACSTPKSCLWATVLSKFFVRPPVASSHTTPYISFQYNRPIAFSSCSGDSRDRNCGSPWSTVGWRSWSRACKYSISDPWKFQQNNFPMRGARLIILILDYNSYCNTGWDSIDEDGFRGPLKKLSNRPERRIGGGQL